MQPEETKRYWVNELPRTIQQEIVLKDLHNTFEGEMYIKHKDFVKICDELGLESNLQKKAGYVMPANGGRLGISTKPYQV